MNTQLKTEALGTVWKLVLLKEFQVEHQTLKHVMPLVSLENLGLYIPVIAKDTVESHQLVLLLLNAVIQSIQVVFFFFFLIF